VFRFVIIFDGSCGGGGYFPSRQIRKGGIHTTTALEGKDMEEGLLTKCMVDLVVEGSTGNARLPHSLVTGEYDTAVMFHLVNLCPH